MISFFTRRVIATVPVVLGVCTLTFMMLHFIPGDPVDIMLGEQATVVDKDALRRELGLDQPLHVQYAKFLTNLASFDFGRSLYSKRSVGSELAERIPATVELGLAAVALALMVGLGLGVIAAIRQNTWLDHLVLAGGILGISLPGFFLAPLLVWIFALHLDWLPVSEHGSLAHLILPSVSLALPFSAILVRMTRASMLEVLREDFIRVARAKGLSAMKIYSKHALRNALTPIITLVGLQLGALLTGAVVTETIFDWPGVGTLLYQAIQSRDYPVVQGCILFISLTYVLVNLLTDVAYAVANPKVRLS
ncbi:MAG: ABC transporter permease [Bdellovibrionales bacterium]|nr:ABC transporter permease [Bdellovibrionales bacterium]